jgi:site-specific DNA-cytosine methylase
MKIRFGSVCSGIEAASVAWHPLGWETAWLSEIEKFPCEVLKHHYPNTPNLGDMTLLADKIQLGEVEAPDVFCGGTPCQAFSVAGLRQSLDDSRGNLSLTFCEIANAIDDRRLIQQSNPAIIFWENVPGVLNTKDNAFGCFLAGLAGESDALIPPGGRWTDAGFIDGPKRAVAWRTLDAQYFGLAQRRKRVFVVASARNDICPAEILFEFEGVRRDTSPSRKEGQEIANCLTKSPSSHSSYNPARSEGNAVVVDWPADKATTLNANFGSKLGLENQHINGGASLFVPSIGYCNDLTPTLTSSAAGISRVGNDTTADSQYIVQQAFRKGRRAQSVDDYETWVDDGKANTFNTFNLGDVRTTHAIALAENTIGRQPQNGGNGNGFTEDGPMYTLNATGVHGIAQAYSFDSLSSNSMKSSNPISGCNEVELSKTLDTNCLNPTANQGGIAVAHAFKVRGGCEGGGKGHLGSDETAFTISTVQDQQIAVGVDTYNLTENTKTTQTLRGFGHIDHVGGVINNMAVRRLTPVECERLQGFPDNYTNIKLNCPDGPRYKALGNSWAVPVVAWIGKRINDAIA